MELNKLDPNAPVFQELRNGKYTWWDNLKSNQDISIQIRKDNTIDVYFNGGAVLTGLEYDKTKQSFTARIHRKYIPLEGEDDDNNPYRPLSLTMSGVAFSEQVNPINFAQLGHKQMAAITNRIKAYYGSGTEKQIQYTIAINDPYIIDTEFQLGKGKEAQRIDLVRLDESVKKLVFVEIKTMGDPRLFPDTAKGKEDIHDQLDKYNKLIHDNAIDLLDYYKKVLQIKSDLGLIKDSDPLGKLSLADWSVEEKPLLAFGDCTQNWIDINSGDIDKRISKVACGAYYYGGTPKKDESGFSLDLEQRAHKNRHIFCKVTTS